MFKLELEGLLKTKEKLYYVKGSKHRISIPEINSDLALFIGLIYGDGWLVSRLKDISKGRWNIGFVEGDIETTKEFVKLAKSLFNIDFKLYPKNRKSIYYEARINSRILYEFLSQNFEMLGGFKSKIIKIPKLIKENNLMEPFIGGLISTDGSIRGSRIAYCSASQELINEVCTFFIKKGFNICRGIYTKNRKNALYYISISGKEQAFKFDQMFLLVGKKRKLLKEALSSFNKPLATV